MADFGLREYLAEDGRLLITTPSFDFDTFPLLGDKLVGLLSATVIEKQWDADMHSWLIDFEASLAGNIEYDIAMFIAVNNISLDLLPYIVGQYQQHADIVQSSAINQVLVLSYLAGCFLLNGLWYSSRTMTSKNNHKTDVVVTHHHNPYHQLAQQQYQRFDQLKLSQHKLTKLLP